MDSGRILALDLGARRIGLAVSDPLGLTAQGLPTLARTSRQADLDALARLGRQYQVGLWLLGLPRHLSGDEGSAAERVRRWGEAMTRHTQRPVEYWDERLTTVEAGRVLRAASSSRGKTRQAIDRLSAVLILQAYLDARTMQAGR